MAQFLVSKSQEAMKAKQKYSADRLKQYLARIDNYQSETLSAGQHPPLLLQFGRYATTEVQRDNKEQALDRLRDDISRIFEEQLGGWRPCGMA